MLLKQRDDRIVEILGRMAHCFELWACAVLAVMCMCGSSSFAQGLGSIVGTVTDSTGAVVPGADVKAVNQGTGQVRETKTNDQGYFVIPSLSPAVYGVTVNANGFAEFSRGNITLLVDQSLTVNAALSPRGQTQTVSVDATALQVDTTTSSLSQVVEQQRIVDLPLNGRNAVSLTQLVPGAAPASSNNLDQGPGRMFPGIITTSFNGSRSNQASFNLDGVNNNDIYTNVNMPFPFPDALQEFSVQTSNYTARYGGSSGAIINAITKSGTDSVHGDVFEFVRNAVFNARNYFASAVDPLKRNQFGGTVGGPVILPRLYNGKGKTFFFFGYQQTEIRDVQNGNSAYVPTAAELGGDFSALLSATNPGNPFGRAYQLVNPITKAPYPNNQIPVSQFDPAAVALTKYLPLAAADPVTGKVFYGIPLSQTFHEYMVRMDQTLTAKDHLVARYYINRFNNSPFLDQGNYLSLAGQSQIYAHNALLSETRILSTNILNDFRVAFSRTTSDAEPPPNSINYNNLGVNMWQPSGAPFIGNVRVNGYFGTVGSVYPFHIYRTNYNFADDLTYIHGRHSMVFGVSALRGQVLLRDDYLAGGNFTFTSDSTNNALAGFLLGSVRTFGQGAGETKDNLDHMIAVYAQDDFHVARKLTLNYGVRWEPFIPWVETKGRVEQFLPANYYSGTRSQMFPNAPAGLLFPGDLDMPSNGVRGAYPIFGLRAGFAWDVIGDGKTSVRGAVGSFHDSQQIGEINNRFVDITPFSPQISVTAPKGTFSNPYLGITNPFPAPAVPPADTLFPGPVLVTTYNPANDSVLNVPTTYNFNLTVEHQFGGGWLARVGYVGGVSRHMHEGVELNPAIYTPGSKLSTDQRRGYVGFGSISQTNYEGVSSYNGLQITAQRRLKSLTLLANYTFSRSLDDIPYGQANDNASGSNDSALPYTNPLRHTFDYGRSEFDLRNTAVVSYVYSLPTFSNQQSLLRNALGGWQTTGILKAQTGPPVTVLAGRDQSQTGLGGDRGLQTLSVSPYGATGCGSGPCKAWLNQAAFSLPAIGSAGNVGKGSLSGPSLLTWDVGLLKNLDIGSDHYRLQFRAEFFNVLNRTNFGLPVNSVSSAGFGTITSASDPRIGQLALKLMF